MISIRTFLSSLLSVSLAAGAVTLPQHAAARTPTSLVATVSFEEPAAVLGLDGPDEEAAKNLTDELRTAFGRRGLGGSEELSLAEVRLTMGCEGEDPACLAEAGQSIGVEFLIYGALEPAGDGYNLTLSILNVPNAVNETATTRPVSAEQLSPENVEETANDIVESLFPQEDEPTEPTPPPPVLEPEPEPEPDVEPKRSDLVWGAYQPRPRWKWVGFGVGVGLAVVGAAGAATSGILLAGPLRDDVFDAAEASLLDCLADDGETKVPCETDDQPRNTNNDVDPEGDADLCARGRSTDRDGNVRNLAVTNACNTADAVKYTNWGSFALMGVGLGLTAVFTTLLFVHRDGKATEALRKHDVRFGTAPLPGGGVLSGGFRF